VNILIVKLSAIGDVVHTLPSLAALRSLYPEAHLTWVVEEGAADLLRGHPCLDRVLVSRRKTWLKALRKGAIAGASKEMREFLARLRDRPYDLVIDFHGLFKSALLAALSGGRRRLGYDSLQELSGFFYNEKIPEDLTKHAVERYLDFIRHLGVFYNEKIPEDLTKHAVERYLDFIRHLGAVPAVRDFTIPADDVNRRRVEELLREEGLLGGSGPLVAVNPVALWPTKLWTQEAFADLCLRLAEGGCRVVLTGAEAEGGYLEGVRVKAKGKVKNLGGRTTLRDLACLYGLADVVVTTDSGPMHIAAAVGTPVVALFGPTDPARTGPYGEGHRVIRRNLPCAPCFRKVCRNNRCLTEIEAGEVLREVEGLLGGRKGPLRADSLEAAITKRREN